MIGSTLYFKKYRKIPKTSPGVLYFSKAFLEGLKLGGDYLGTEICVSKSICASLIIGRKFTISALFYFVFEGNF